MFTSTSKTLLSSAGTVLTIKTWRCTKQCSESTLGKCSLTLAINLFNILVIALFFRDNPFYFEVFDMELYRCYGQFRIWSLSTNLMDLSHLLLMSVDSSRRIENTLLSLVYSRTQHWMSENMSSIRRDIVSFDYGSTDVSTISVSLHLKFQTFSLFYNI